MVYRYTKAPTQRQLRIAESIKHALSEIISRNELSQPVLEQMFLTVSEVRISADLKLATAFVSTLNTVNKKELIRFLNVLAPQMRILLCKKINLKFAPEVRFAYDTSFEEGEKIEGILQGLK